MLGGANRLDAAAAGAEEAAAEDEAAAAAVVLRFFDFLPLVADSPFPSCPSCSALLLGVRPGPDLYPRSMLPPATTRARSLRTVAGLTPMSLEIEAGLTPLKRRLTITRRCSLFIGIAR